MIQCDYCTKPIAKNDQAVVVMPPLPVTAERLDLHAECYEPWLTQAAKVRGDRPDRLDFQPPGQPPGPPPRPPG